jgi:hypothetical protein
LIASGEAAVVCAGDAATWPAAGKTWAAVGKTWPGKTWPGKTWPDKTWAAAGSRLMLAKPADNKAIESGVRIEDS